MSDLVPHRESLPVSVQVTPPRIRPGDRLDVGAVIYEAIRKVEQRVLFVREDTGAEVWLNAAELIRKFAAGEARIALPGWLPEARHKKWNGDFASLSEDEKRRAYMRLAHVQAVQENARLGYPRRIKDVIADVHRRRIADPVNAGDWHPSIAVVYEWKVIWEYPEGPKGILRLAFAESERGKRQMPEHLAELLKQAIVEHYMTPERRRVTATHDRFVALCRLNGIAEEAIHGQRTTRRAIGSLSPYAVARARHGQRAADLLYRAKGKLPATPLPGEVYEVDAHKFDLVVVDSGYGFVLGRLWVTVVIDRCTRMVVGFHVHLEPPCSLTVAAALRNAIASKEYVQQRWPDLTHPWVTWGMPTMVVLDNGLENRAVFLQEAAAELGFTIHYAETRTPEDKAYVERFFGTAEAQFVPMFPGGTGRNPQARGDYDAEGMACVTLKDVDEFFHRWVITVYGRGWHEGIRDIPERLWLEKTAVWGVEPYSGIDRLDVLLGNYAERVPSANGIHLLGLRYNDLGENRPLEMIRTRAGAGRIEKLRIRFDPTNLGFIWVQDPETRRYHVLECVDREYSRGLTLAQHRVIRRHAVERARGYVSVNDLCATRDALRQRVREILGDPDATGRKAATIFNGLGSKGSWGAMYRYAEAEYKDRPIVDLLEIGRDEDDIPLFGLPAEAPPERSPSTVAAKPDAAAPSSVSSAAAGRPVQPDAPVSTETGAAIPVAAANALPARVAALGMTVEGLDD